MSSGKTLAYHSQEQGSIPMQGIFLFMVFIRFLGIEGQGSNPGLDINHFSFDIDSEITVIDRHSSCNDGQIPGSRAAGKLPYFYGQIFYSVYIYIYYIYHLT